MTSVAAQSGHTARGVVPDPSGAAAAGAEVQVLGASQTLAGAARTDEQGRFVVTVPRPGTYMLVIRSAGFADTRTSITVPLAGDQVLELTTRF